MKVTGCKKERYFIIAFVLFSITLLVNGKLYYAELETLKQSERDALSTFKQLVSPILPHMYMKEDIYLIKFLAFNNFTVSKAETQLKEMLKWRKDNNVDRQLNNPSEEFVALQNDFPIYVDGYDKEERPICEVPYGSWPIRRAAAAGIMKKVILHMFVNCAERLAVKVRELQAQGKNVTQWIFLANFENFVLEEHTCPACLPLALNFAVGGEKYYPLWGNGTYFINTPDSFASMYRLMRPLMSSAAKAVLKVFSTRKADWQPFLEQRMDMNEISHWYGGAKEREWL